MIAAVVIGCIRLYQATLSPDHGLLRRLGITPGRCRYYPSCSEYAIQSIQKHGLAAGLSLALRRVARCHPFARGGVDEP